MFSLCRHLKLQGQTVPLKFVLKYLLPLDLSRAQRSLSSHLLNFKFDCIGITNHLIRLFLTPPPKHAALVVLKTD